MNCDLCKTGDGYQLSLEANNKTFWLKITEEEAEILKEQLEVEIIEIPF